MHTLRRSYTRPILTRRDTDISGRRHFNLDGLSSKTLLEKYSIPISETPLDPEDSLIVGITIARSSRSPCLLVSPTSSHDDAVQIPFSYSKGPSGIEISEAIAQLGLRRAPSQIRESVDDLIANIWKAFLENQAIAISVSINQDDSTLIISSPTISLDPASPANTVSPTPSDGIVFISLPDPSASIGTLVNGAGLAMNTCDALTRRGLSPTNFLDTGGKATSETVAKSFQMVLSDERVKVLFVNIFGGLTKGDMIARGIIQAFEMLKDEGGVRVPVVVRIRGTREKEGQDIITESGLEGIFAYDGFEEAVEKIQELLQT
jgi:succinyl-CoA synthetase alpha subunit